MEFIKGSTIYDDLGKINYHYILLKHLKKDINKVEPLQIVQTDSNPVKYENVIEKPADMVFEVISNLDPRLLWNKGIKELKYDKNKINRAGMKHVCVFTGSQVEIETIKKDSGDSKLIYGEKIHDAPIVKEITFYYILENLNESTKVKIEIHLNPASFLGKFLKPLARLNLKRSQEIMLFY